MMHNYSIQHKSLTVEPISSPSAIDQAPIHRVDHVNWVDFPGGPETTFQIGHFNGSLLVKFTIQESAPRAVVKQDLGPVWEDSCVEMFLQIPGQERYFNFEFNSRGACVASSRIGKNEGVEFFTPEQLPRLTRCPVVEKNRWTITIQLPLDLLSVDSQANEIELRGNFYKCGDKTKEPHFLSWSPIVEQRPNFHCPVWFGNIKLLSAGG
ncbi:MAG: hypothetical protein LIO91_06825 [Bacteroidales bacterium]|nr:hypothetical protein [Bacteroidales bacterium]